MSNKERLAKSGVEPGSKASLASIHVAVVLFGLSGLFAKLLNLPAIIITFGRVFFSSIFLMAIFGVKRESLGLKRKKDYFIMVGAGIILAVHWSSFLQSIQSSTVAVGTLTFSTFPLFITFLEPYFFGEKLQKSSVAAAMTMFLGVMLIVPKFEMGNQITVGVMWGMLSSFTYAVLALLNRSFSGRYKSALISLYEQATAAVVLLPAFFVLKPSLGMSEIGLLVLLGTVFTAVAHSMFISGLKGVRAHTAGIISSMESVYGILAALLLLGEIPSVRELAGGAVIMGVVFYSTLKSK